MYIFVNILFIYNKIVLFVLSYCLDFLDKNIYICERRLIEINWWRGKYLWYIYWCINIFYLKNKIVEKKIGFF